MVAGLFLAGLIEARADPESLPDLTERQRDTLLAGREPAASYGDPAFDALLESTRSWDRRMHRWAASRGLAPEPVTPGEIGALLSDPDASAGLPVVMLAEFLEREPLPKYANVERWLVAPLDPERPGVRSDRAAVVFVDRTTSAAFDRARPGWYVHLATRFYKPLVLPRRTTGEQTAYPAFVGASFAASQHRGDSASGYFAYIGLGVALMIAVFVTLLVIVSKVRSRPSPLASTVSASVPSIPDRDGQLPSDPAEALKRLDERARSTDNHPHA